MKKNIKFHLIFQINKDSQIPVHHHWHHLLNHQHLHPLICHQMTMRKM